MIAPVGQTKGEPPSVSVASAMEPSGVVDASPPGASVEASGPAGTTRRVFTNAGGDDERDGNDGKDSPHPSSRIADCVQLGSTRERSTTPSLVCDLHGVAPGTVGPGGFVRPRALVIAGGAVAALVSLAACASSEAERRPVSYVPAEAYDVASPSVGENAAQAPAPMWPHVFESGGTTFATYEPTVTSWKDDKLQARVAVAVHTPGAKTPRYGEVLFESATRTDSSRGVVTLGDIRITRARFPTAKDKEAAYAEALRGAQLVEATTVEVDRLERQVAYGATERARPRLSRGTRPRPRSSSPIGRPRWCRSTVRPSFARRVT